VKKKTGVLIVIGTIVVTYSMKKYLIQRRFVHVLSQRAEMKSIVFMLSIIHLAGIVLNHIINKKGSLSELPFTCPQ
jgi:hypothetical protein